MKQLALLLLILAFVSGVALAQEVTESGTGAPFINAQKPEWGTIVRFNPENIYFAVTHIAPQVSVTVVPHLVNEIGIPLAITFSRFPAIPTGYSTIELYTGVEITPLADFAPGGLFLSGQAGPIVALFYGSQSLSWGGKADIGWQFVSIEGLVVTPAVGIQFVADSQNSRVVLDVMLDIGFAVPK